MTNAILLERAIRTQSGSAKGKKGQGSGDGGGQKQSKCKTVRSGIGGPGANGGPGVGEKGTIARVLPPNTIAPGVNAEFSESTALVGSTDLEAGIGSEKQGGGNGGGADGGATGTGNAPAAPALSNDRTGTPSITTTPLESVFQATSALDISDLDSNTTTRTCETHSLTGIHGDVHCENTWCFPGFMEVGDSGGEWPSDENANPEELEFDGVGLA